jgi:hypothetical protein
VALAPEDSEKSAGPRRRDASIAWVSSSRAVSATSTRLPVLVQRRHHPDAADAGERCRSRPTHAVTKPVPADHAPASTNAVMSNST